VLNKMVDGYIMFSIPGNRLGMGDGLGDFLWRRNDHEFRFGRPSPIFVPTKKHVSIKYDAE